MKNYLRVHLVQAEPMTRGEHLKSKNLAFIPAPGTSEDDPGYLVVYPDGYCSWCPKAAFEKQGFEIQRDDKITPEDIRAFASLGTQNVKKIGEKTTIVSRKYSTGIEDYATSSCVDPKNYDHGIGAGVARESLDDRVWMFLGWLLAWAKNGVDHKTAALPEEAAAPAEVAKPVDPVEPDAGPAVLTPMSFGDAIEAMKAGKKVARRGWNGKGMWLCIPLRDGPREIPAEGIWGEPNADYAKRNGGTVKVMPYVTMKAADGSIVMGWLASQTDMLALDWQVVD